MGSEVKWIHLDVDMFENRKIKYLRRLPAGNDIILIWVMLLTLAGRCNAGGMIFLTQNIPYTVKMLADELDFEENTVKLALEALESVGMISNDGFLSITGWEEHQDSEGLYKLREYNRIAKQKSRDRQKQKQLEYLNNVNDMSLTCQETTLDSSLSLSISNSISNSKDSDRGVGEEEEKQIDINKCSDDVIQKWNSTRLPSVYRVKADSDRGKRLRARIKDYGVDEVLRAVDIAANSDFLQEQHWFDFGWFVRPENFVKVIEGKYNRDGIGENKRRRDGGSTGADKGNGTKFSDLQYIRPDDESTWGA